MISIATAIFFVVTSFVLFGRNRKLRLRSDAAAKVLSYVKQHNLYERSGYLTVTFAVMEETVSTELQNLLDLDEDAGVEAVFSCFSDQDYVQLKKLLATLKQGNAVEECEVTMGKFAREGTRYFSVNGSMIRDENHISKGVILWFTDITKEQRNVEVLFQENTKLKEQLHQFSTLCNAIPFPLWQRSSDMRITYCNVAYSKLIEDASQMAGETLELARETKELAKSVAESKTSVTETYRLIVNGERHLYAISEVPLSNKTQLGYAVDVTDREEVKNELKRYVSLQSDLLESSASAAAIFGANYRLEFYNNAFKVLWNFEESWLATKPHYGDMLELLRERRQLPEQVDFKEFKKQHLQFFTDLNETTNEFFHLPDGKALRVIVIPSAVGGLLFSYEDMTDRLAFERSYNTLIAVQKATLDHLHEGVVVFGEDGKLKLCNPVYAKMWGLDPNFLKLEPHYTDIIEKVQAYFTPAYREGLRKEGVVRLAGRETTIERIERVDGVVLDRISVPLPDGATLINFVDVTVSILAERTLREKNEALEAADRLKTEFLANMSYELRSPLTSILGFTELLQKRYMGPLNDRQDDYVTGIYSSSQQLKSLIDDILDLASIEAGYMRLDCESFGIYDALDKVVHLFSNRASEKSITMEIVCDDAIGKIYGDVRRIKQIIYKLISNALQFSEEGDKIIIGAKCYFSGQFIALYVQDSGIGIPEEMQANIFDHFYQTEEAEDLGNYGAGLGLSVVKKFVQLHGGRVRIWSRPGLGTRVSCVLYRNPTELTLAHIEDGESVVPKLAHA